MTPATKLAALEKLAEKALKLGRTPYKPPGGIGTGDMVMVGLMDWNRLLRFARFAAATTAEKGRKG